MIWTGYKTRSFGSFRFNSFCWAVWVVWIIFVGSHSSELRINNRLFFYIPNSFRKVLKNFEILFQPDELVD